MGLDWAKEELVKQGVIFLTGEVNDDTADRVCSEIVAFNTQGEVPRIQLIVNSCGGDCQAGFSIIDLMGWSSIPVCTTGTGVIASMGFLIFMAGEKGKRYLTPTTAILSHRHRSGNRGSHGEMKAWFREHELNHERMVQHYLAHGNVSTREELESYLLREVDTWLTPDEAVHYGLADVVAPMREMKRRLAA